MLKLFKKEQNKTTFTTYSQFVSVYLDQLFSVAYRFTGNKMEAEDLVQDLVLKLQPRFEEIKHYDKPMIWMTKVMYRMFVDSYRREKRSPVQLISDFNNNNSDLDYFDTVDSLQNMPLDFVESLELISELQLAMNKLDEEDRLLIVLYEVEGYSIAELQQIVDLPAGTLKSRLFRARKKLRKVMTNATDSETQSCKVVS